MDVVSGDQVVEEELSDPEEVSFNNTPLIFYKGFVSVVSYLWYSQIEVIIIIKNTFG